MGGASKTILIAAERAQRVVLKVMSFRRYRYPTSLLYTEIPVLTVRQLFIKNVILFQHKKPPDYTNKRRKDLVYDIPRCRKSFANKFLKFLGPYIYNKLSKLVQIRNCSNYSCKTEIDKLLKQYNYEDTEKILQVMK